MDIDYFKINIYNDMIFKKVTCSSKIIKVYNDGFTYKIGTNNSKKVNYEEVYEAIKEIEINGFINRKWYENTFPKKSKSNPCNFTTIGGVLQELGYVSYINGRYEKN